MLGGTAAMYTSLLHHPSSSLTPLSVLYMLLLAIQTSIQPRLSRKYIPKHTSKVRVVLVEEVIKTSAASIMFWGISGKEVVQAALKGVYSSSSRRISCSDTSFPHNLLIRSLSFFQLELNTYCISSWSVTDWTLQSSLLVAGLPACLYAVQGVLTYMSHQHLDSVTFNGLSQTKTLSAALCCYMVMGKRQSPLQLVALGLLFLSAIVFQNHRISGTGANAQTGHDGKGDTSFLIKGVIPCLIATFISGLAGAFSQRGLQMVGGNGRNAFLYTVEVSFFSALALLVPQLISSSSRDSKSVKNQRSAETNDRMLSAKSLIPISSKAMGGILTALVHKYAGSVVKGFALMLGLVMSGILQSLWVEENNKDGSNNDTKATKGALKWHQVAGIAIVMFSSWLHFTNPPVST